MAGSLDDYQKKRDFKRTPEPRPRAHKAPRQRAEAPVFVVHRHEARRLHYDLRLEYDGSLMSWAVPKGFSYDPKAKHLAVRTEDHPLSYEDFEGVIPKGEYGAGTMTIWDRGTWQLVRGDDAGHEVEGGELKFVLEGSKLRGEWHLVKTKRGDRDWLLFKARDRYAGSNPFSRGLDLTRAKRADLPRAFRRMDAGRHEAEAFREAGWVFEMRFDGLRCALEKSGDSVRMRGVQRAKAIERRCPELIEAVRRLAAERALLDGCLVCLDEGERPSREVLDARLRGENDATLYYYAFDLLHYDDWDLRSLGLVERKAALASLLDGVAPIQFVDHVAQDGVALAEALGRTGLGGMIAKRGDSRYVGRASEDWVEIEARNEPSSELGELRFKDALALESSKARSAFSNLDKVYWPGSGYTKGELIEYYSQLADVLLPHLRDRPLHLNRFPDGIDGKNFYQKNAPDHFPDWIEIEEIESRGKRETIRYVICNDAATLLYLVNTGSIELHPWLSRRSTPDSPDIALIDLDPKQAPFADVVRIARTVGKLLRGCGLRPLLKTSGKTGLHIVVPLVPGYSYEHSRMFCEGIARLVCREHREIATIERDIDKRGDRVYVDFLQNRRGQTIVPPYCVRPVIGARVSAPLDWDELDFDLDPMDFTIRTMPQRVASKGDLFAAALSDPQELLPAIEKLTQR